MTTFMPSAANRSASASPIPLAAPVTTATRSRKLSTAGILPLTTLVQWTSCGDCHIHELSAVLRYIAAREPDHDQRRARRNVDEPDGDAVCADQGGFEMKKLLTAVLVVALPAWLAPVAEAQTPGEVFRKVAPSVVVIRAKGRDISVSGQSRFAETGSGVLISQDGKVMTAAHVVHAMDEISVEFLGGETVKAKVVASEPAADLSLLQLERVPAGAKSSPLADSDKIQVGDPVIIVGAPYGLSYSLSDGLISARWKPNTVYKTMPLAEFFQTTATINTGNSGGPMF